MALTQWKDFDDFFTDPWRHHRELFLSSKLNNPWKDEFKLDWKPFDLQLQPFPWDFKDFDRRARELHERLQREIVGIVPTIGKDGFEVCVDARQFTPNEITVKISGGSVIIEGKHEEKQGEHGYISRQITQRYDLPSGYDVNTITSELSSDGYLTVKAPQPKAIENKERIISIQKTGEKRGQLVST